jgi:hypothetical protein
MSPSDSEPFISPGTGFPFRRRLWVTRLGWKVSGRTTENTASSIVACWFTAAEMCLPHSCVATSAARIHRERRLQRLFYPVTSQRMWRVPLLRVYGPLPGNDCFSASTVLALSKYATIDWGEVAGLYSSESQAVLWRAVVIRTISFRLVKGAEFLDFRNDCRLLKNTLLCRIRYKDSLITVRWSSAFWGPWSLM